MLLCCFHASAQKRDYYWVFGSSVDIDFNTIPPTVDTTRSILTEEPSASISDNVGNLQFYVGCSSLDQSNNGFKKFTVRSYNDSIMLGGDSLIGNGSMTQGLLIIPRPGFSTEYYIFHINYPGDKLYYSTLDMSLNNGFGEVTSSNILLSDSMSEKLNAVKAANGKDWWIVAMGHKPQTYFYIYKLDSNAISFKGLSNTATTAFPDGWCGQMIFSKEGDKLLSAGCHAKTYIYDFDRCTGVISNPIFIDDGQLMTGRYGASFSPNGQYIYLSSADSLWQFDIQATNIPASKQLIFSIPNSNFRLGQHLLAPDGKIYIVNPYIYPTLTPNDSMNSHLSVINAPNNAGIFCNFSAYSFSLEDRKSYSGLPNMPNYNLGVLENVNCDSILATNINNSKQNQHFNLYPNPAQNYFTVEAVSTSSHLKTIECYTIEGELLIRNNCPFSSSKIIFETTQLKSGIYFVKIIDDEGASHVKKVVISK